MELKPGYKQTEVGVIPEDWDCTQLGKCLLAPPSYGINSPAVPYSDNLPVYIRITDISEDGRFKPDKLVSVRSELAANYYLGEGDIVFARTGASVGKSYLYDTGDGPLVYAGFLIRVRPEKERLRPAFAAAYVTTDAYWRWVRLMSMRSGQPGINGREYAQLPIPLPSTSEQSAIAEILTDLDTLLSSLKLLINKKTNIKQAAMQELLTGKRRLPGFEGGWEVTTVKDVVSRHFCGPSPTCEERNIEGDHEWGVLKTTAITWEKGWSWKAHKLLPPSCWDKTDIELRKGDVLVTKAGPRHRVGVSAWVDHLPGRIIPSGKMIALRPILKKAEPLMLAAAIASRETQIFLDQRTTGMAESQVNFENSVLLSAPISLPSIEEQSAISGICSDFDKEIRDLENKIDSLRGIKEGMMQQLLTGKIRLQ